MGAAIGTVVAICAAVLIAVLVLDWLEQRARTRERANVRRLVDYMNMIPRRSRPW